MAKIFRGSFDSLASADLVIDAIYESGPFKDVRADPIQRLVPGVGNQGGFRYGGSPNVPGCRIAVLYSTFAEPDWPDRIDSETGTLIYFGDNRTPGHKLHETQRGGNQLLQACFAAVHNSGLSRSNVPPFLVFAKAGSGRDVQFKGLAAPSGPSVTAQDDLVAVWRNKGGQRFQNYKATFTLLDVPVVGRTWLDHLRESGDFGGDLAPRAWSEWRSRGVYLPLKAPRVSEYRSKKEQLPDSDNGMRIIRSIHEYFATGWEFEPCAMKLAVLMQPNIVEYDLTRPWRDGGKDAFGKLRLRSMGGDWIDVEFALEAKRYAPDQGVGVEPMSRLISRIKYRQFGIMVTTSYVDTQAYKEVKIDGHPILIIAAADIVKILAAHGISTPDETLMWLKREFPKPSS